MATVSASEGMKAAGDAIQRLRPFLGYTLFTLIWTYATMALGPLVRAEDAGLSCPDWPLCFGYVIPPLEYRVYLEFIHRALAGVLGIFILGWAGWIFAIAELRARFAWHALGALALLGTQVALGAATVTQLLDPYIVKSHLINALFLFSVIFVVWIRARYTMLTDSRSAFQAGGRGSLVMGLFVGLIVVMFFVGGRVSTNYAAMACGRYWPSCEVGVGAEAVISYFPPMQGLVEMHMSHRYLAYFILLCGLALVWYSRRANWSAVLKSNTVLIMAVLAAQVVLGILNVFTGRSTVITTMHSATAIALYIMAFFVWRQMRLGDELASSSN